MKKITLMLFSVLSLSAFAAADRPPTQKSYNKWLLSAPELAAREEQAKLIRAQYDRENRKLHMKHCDASSDKTCSLSAERKLRPI